MIDLEVLEDREIPPSMSERRSRVAIYLDPLTDERLRVIGIGKVVDWDSLVRRPSHRITQDQDRQAQHPQGGSDHEQSAEHGFASYHPFRVVLRPRALLAAGAGDAGGRSPVAPGPFDCAQGLQAGRLNEKNWAKGCWEGINSSIAK